MFKICSVAVAAATLFSTVFIGTSQASDPVQRVSPLNRPHVPGEVVVRFAPDASATERSQARASVDGERDASLGIRGLELVELDGASVSDAVSELEARDEVLYAEPNYIYEATAIPNDARFAEQWALHASNDVDIDAPEAWDRVTGDGSVTVAIVDTGVAYDHPDLAANTWTNPGESGSAAGNGIDDDNNGYVDDAIGWDWVDGDNEPSDLTGHGTHVAGTIGARGNDGIGVSGVAWNVKLMPLRVLAASGSGTSAAIASAFDYAGDNGAAIVNASFGRGGYSRAIADAVAAHPKSLFVAAAGNEGTDNDLSDSYPCNLSNANVICVGALTSSNSLASYSNHGSTTVDLAAPGSSIVNTIPRRSTVFGEEFEADVATRWSSGGSGPWGPEAGKYGSAYSDSPGTSYANGSDSWLETTQPVQLSGTRGCALSYSVKQDADGGDMLRIYASNDGSDWHGIVGYVGSTEGKWFSLTKDLGKLATDGSPLYLRFRFTADGSGTGDGVAIDEVAVRCALRDYTGTEYSYFSGTSMATPHVAGAAALLAMAAPSKSVAEIKTALLDGVDPVASLAGLTVTGGRLNLAAALEKLVPTPAEVPPAPDGGTGGIGDGGSTPTVEPTPEPDETDAPVEETPVEEVPAVEPIEPIDPIEHSRSVSVKVLRGPRLKGRVRASDLYAPCVSGGRVVIRRKGRYLKTVTTDATGHFVTRIPRKAGRYVAIAKQSEPTDGHICLTARAFTVR